MTTTLTDVDVTHLGAAATATPPVVSESEASTALTISEVSKVFGGRGSRHTVLSHVDLSVRQGEFVTIVGASGCGKSTLLNLVAGLDEPSSGTIDTGGRKVAFMFQEATLLPWLTARKNVELALRLRGVPRDERRVRAAELLTLTRLDGAMDKRPHELSGGMRQRVSLARVLAQDASIVLMDEPLGALDAMTRDTMHDEIERIWLDAGLTVLFVTHNVREAVRLGDRVVLLSSSPGRVKAQYEVDVPRPRRMDDADVAHLSGRLTDALRDEVARHVG